MSIIATAGIHSISVDDDRFLAKSAVEFRESVVQREKVEGHMGLQGVKEAPAAGMIKVTLTMTDNMNLKKLTTGKAVTVVVQLRNGRTLVGEGCVYVGDGLVSTEELEVNAEWASNNVRLVA